MNRAVIFALVDSVILLLLFSWVLLLQGADVLREGFSDDPSYLPYWVTFGFATSAAVLLFLVELAAGLLRAFPRWHVRATLVFVVYAISAVAAAFTIIWLDTQHKVAYFGGDAAGSFGMLLMPTALLALLACGVVWLVRGAVKLFSS